MLIRVSDSVGHARHSTTRHPPVRLLQQPIPEPIVRRAGSLLLHHVLEPSVGGHQVLPRHPQVQLQVHHQQQGEQHRGHTQTHHEAFLQLPPAAKHGTGGARRTVARRPLDQRLRRGPASVSGNRLRRWRVLGLGALVWRLFGRLFGMRCVRDLPDHIWVLPERELAPDWRAIARGYRRRGPVPISRR